MTNEKGAYFLLRWSERVEFCNHTQAGRADWHRGPFIRARARPAPVITAAESGGGETLEANLYQGNFFFTYQVKNVCFDCVSCYSLLGPHRLEVKWMD